MKKANSDKPIKNRKVFLLDQLKPAAEILIRLFEIRRPEINLQRPGLQFEFTSDVKLLKKDQIIALAKCYYDFVIDMARKAEL
jgi:hypothetical protein